MDHLLDDAKRMMLGWRGQKGPVLAPMAFWSDGRHLWSTTSSSAGKVAALDVDPECVAYVAPAIGAEGFGLVLRGRARIYRPTDVVAMATHGAVIAAAQAALAVKQVSSVAGYLADAPRIPRSWRPDNRVTIRITLDEQTPVSLPAPGPGIAPPLPTGVPPEVRRRVAGRRDIVLGTLVDGGLGILPAVWNADFGVQLPEDVRIPQGSPCSAVLDFDEGFRPTAVAGVAVNGLWTGAGIAPSRVRWWSGFDSAVIDAAQGQVHQIVIPD